MMTFDVNIQKFRLLIVGGEVEIGALFEAGHVYQRR